MVLVAAVAAGFAAALIRARLAGRPLQSIELRHTWLVFAAVLPQIVLFQIPAVGQLLPDRLVSTILLVSQALLVGFAVLNIDNPGVVIMGAGLVANFLVIALNGGWMPVSPETVRRILPSLPADFLLENRRLGLSKDWIIPASEIHLPWLADRFTPPDWFSYQFAFSFGDILIAIGAFYLLWSLSNPKKLEEV